MNRKFKIIPLNDKKSENNQKEKNYFLSDNKKSRER